MSPPPTEPAWSAYDAATPHPEGLGGVRARMEALRRRRDPVPAGALASVREVVVVASSSRGGSTLLGELLRHAAGLAHLRAEVNPFFVVAGLSPGSEREVLEAELASDVGSPAPAQDLGSFALDVAWRLSAQWPAEEFDPDAVARWVAEALGGRGPEPGFDRDAFHLRLLARVRAAHPGVNPYYYDLAATAVRAAFPDAAPPAGPPGEALIEMPPFVLLGPWRRATPDEWARSPLVLTTPRNSFRLDFWRSFFPRARLRVVHLVRNPAAAVNGLVDGWRHHGFFNCAVERPLAIAGYSDAFPAWGRRWWNYDFVPGWEELTARSLPEVCASQWRAPHEATLEFLGRTGVEHLRLRYEDVVGPAEARRKARCELGEWLGVRASTLLDLRLDPVMATAPPRPRRWAERAPELGAALADEAVLSLARRLGYDADPDTWT